MIPPPPVAQRIAGPFATALGPGDSLQAQNTGLLVDGTIAQVNDVQLQYFLDKDDNTTPPVGTVVIKPALGPGRWFRQSGSGGALSINVSAGTTSQNLTNFALSNSNNVSFGLNGSTVTASASFNQTNQSLGFFAAGNTTQNSSTTLDARSMTIQGAGNVSVGYSNGSIVVSGGTAAVGNVNFSAGTTSSALSAVTFSNANGVSFGLNGATITASINPPSGSINLSAGTTSQNLSAFTLSNSNNVSFGLNGSTVTASASFAQTNQSLGLFAVGNTTQNSSTTADARSLSFDGLGGATVGFSNGSVQISAPTTAGLLSAVNLSAGTTSHNLSAFTLSNSNGVSFGLNGSVVTASHAVNLSAGTTSQNLSAFTLSNSNNVSFGLNGSTITASASFVAQTNQSLGFFAVGNTTQSSSTTLDARTLSLDGLGGVSVGYSNGSIQISGPTTAGLLSAVNLSAGTTSQNLSAFTLSNSNNVSFGLNGSTITASASFAAQSNQSLGLFAVGNTTQSSSTTADARSLSFDGLGGASVGYSNGSIQISAPTTAGLISAFNVSAGTTSSNLTGAVFSNSNGVSFGLSGGTITASFTPAGAASFNLSAGTTSQNLTNFVLSNSNGVSFGLNGSTVTGSVAVQTNQGLGLFAVGNTTQSSSTTADARSLSFDGLGAATVGFSNGSVQISAPLQTNQTLGMFAVGNTTQNSSTTLDARTLSFQGAGNVSVGYSNGSIVVSGGTAAAGNVNFSAGTTSSALSAVTFSNSNGVSFGLNGATMTGSVAAQTNQSVGLYAVGNTTQNSSTTLDARTLSFDGLGGASVGYSNGSIQISAPTTAGLLSAVNLSAGTTSQNLSAFTLSNSNNVSFGLNGSTITASASFAAQTNQSVGLYAVGNTTQNSSTTLDARTLSFDGLGGATVGYSNGSIQISAPTTAGLLSGVNLSAGTTSQNLSAFTLSNSNGVSFGLNGSVVTASHAVNLSAGTTSQNLSAFTLSNSNNVSFGLNGSTITASASFAAQTNQSLGFFAVGNTTQSSSTTLDARTLSLDGLGGVSVGYSNGSIQISGPTTAGLLSAVNLSAGTTSQNLSAFTLSNSNNVSFGLNGSTVTASASFAQTNQTVGLYAVSNTTQNSSTTLDARTLSFQGAGIASVGYSNGSIVVSVPAGAGSVNFSAGTTSQNLTAVTFSNSNGVSFGLNGSTITGSVAAQTNQTVGMYAVGNTTQNSSTTLDARTLSFDGLGGITVGFSNGSVQISGPSNSLVFSNTNNVVFGTAGGTTVTASAYFNVSAGTTSQNLSSFTLSNSNGVSFGLNGSTITGSVAAQTNQSVGLYAVGNTTQNSSTTLDARTLSFQGAGIASVGYSNGSIVVSVPAGGAGSLNLSAGTTSQNLTNFVLSNSNNVSFGLNGSTVTATASFAAQTNQTVGLYAVGNTTQNSSTTLDARTLSFDGLGGASVGYSNGSIQISIPNGTVSFQNSNNITFGSAGGTTITASYGPPPVSTYEPYPIQNTGTAALSGNTASSGSATFIPFEVDTYVAAGFLNMVMSNSLVTGGISSGRQSLTNFYGLYSRGTGANSTTLSGFTTGSFSLGVTYNNLSLTINQPTTTNSGGYSTGTVSSSGVGLTATYDALFLVQFPIASTLTPGYYWLGLFAAQSTSSNAVGFSQSYIGNAMSLTALAPFGSASSNSGTNAINPALGANWLAGGGVFTSAGQTNLPATVAMSALTQNLSVIPYMKFVST